MLRTAIFLTSIGVASLFVATSAAAADSSRAEGAIDDGNPRVQVGLILEATQAAVGERVRVGVHFKMDPDWHVYWRNSGDSGLSTDFTVDSGLEDVSEMSWPAPSVFVDPSGEVGTFGYADEVVFTRSGRVPNTEEDVVNIVATVDYLACKIDCIPGRHELKTSLKVGPRKPAGFPNELADSVPFTPSEVDLATEISFSRKSLRPGQEVIATIGVRCAGTSCDSAIVRRANPLRYSFIPDVNESIEWNTESVERIENGTSLRLRGRVKADSTNAVCELAGVLWVETNSLVPIYVSESIPCENPPLLGPVSTEPVPPARPPTAPPPSLPYILLLALVGGMLLNLMPCVFPVLAVKVFSFVKLAHENQSSVLRHSGAYTAGIVTTMMALAACVVGLKAAGSEVGWGFQFQEPLFIALLASALVLFALNLFGVFEITLGSGGIDAVREAEHGTARSFGEGVLAVVLATPCSAPFLGTAVGFAFGANTWTIFAVFFVLGIGLALPFAVLTAVPAWARLLPRPGEWMLTFKQLLGFALLGTCVWLVWVLGQNSGVGSVSALLVFLLTVGCASWAWGKVQFRTGVGKWLIAATSMGLVIGVGWVTLDFSEPAAPIAAEKSTSGGPASWPAFSEDAVAADVAKGNVVFVDFTADWCITCKVNERGVLSSPEVAALFDEYQVQAYVADWTRKDDRIRKILAQHGKAGVPMYLLYRPNEPNDPEVLPELLTPDMLRDAITRAATAN